MLNVQVVGAERVIAALDGFPPKLLGFMKDEVNRLSIALLRYVKEKKLSGDPLRNRTGTLRAKVNQRLDVSGNEVTGAVGVKLSYAAAHEYGFNGTVKVREHLRQVKQAWGRALLKPVWAHVGAHTRQMRLPERSYLRSALREMEPQIQEGLKAAVRRAVEKA